MRSGHTAPVSCVEHRWASPTPGRFDAVLARRSHDPNVAEESSNALAKSCDSLLADGGVVLVAFERRGVDLQVLIDAFAALARWSARAVQMVLMRTFSRSARMSRRCSGTGV